MAAVRLGSQHKFVQSGLSVDLPLPIVLLWIRHPERAYWQPSQGKLQWGKELFLSLAVLESGEGPDQPWESSTEAGPQTSVGTVVCAPAGAALMRTAHVALYFGELSQFVSCWFSISSSDDCIDTGDWVARQIIGVWFCLPEKCTHTRRSDGGCSDKLSYYRTFVAKAPMSCR
ncbi:hypothetical protein PpBr36_08542 [Pyricularia pennisetigena]|uniref:hypothetical protein n=1 Tax=Pyricularia pennisetigena TaxID=1578925 RepID=UPI00114EF283|nr:hypothetical protein PpBr36_08542 [Pyricularia pennisetigena]TLS23919.1 hypothetical protein PpBr36_08542 [Pyricularia pennisetigena]